MNGERSMEAYTLWYVKWIANGNLLYDSGTNWGSITTQRTGKGQKVGGRFKREETHIHLCLIYADVWQKSNQYCEAIILQLKKITRNKTIILSSNSTTGHTPSGKHIEKDICTPIFIAALYLGHKSHLYVYQQIHG